MPPESINPEDPREWLRRARSNLARAAQGQATPEILLEDLCFDAQQAVEKALKALVISKGVQVPRTHALGELITRLRTLDVEIPMEVEEASVLTDYAVATRYPGPSEPVLMDDYDQAVAIARMVVQWASGILADTSAPEDRDGS